MSVPTNKKLNWSHFNQNQKLLPAKELQLVHRSFYTIATFDWNWLKSFIVVHKMQFCRLNIMWKIIWEILFRINALKLKRGEYIVCQTFFLLHEFHMCLQSWITTTEPSVSSPHWAACVGAVRPHVHFTRSSLDVDTEQCQGKLTLHAFFICTSCMIHRFVDLVWCHTCRDAVGQKARTPVPQTSLDGQKYGLSEAELTTQKCDWALALDLNCITCYQYHSCDCLGANCTYHHVSWLLSLNINAFNMWE